MKEEGDDFERGDQDAVYTLPGFKVGRQSRAYQICVLLRLTAEIGQSGPGGDYQVLVSCVC